MEKLMEIAQGLNKAFPKGNEPFQIITRLVEECGELAKEINHWERTGAKVKKYGEPSTESLANEIKNVITCSLQIALFYKVENELKIAIDNSLENLRKKGFIG